MRAGPLLVVFGLLLIAGVAWLVLGSVARERGGAGPERRAAPVTAEPAGELERPSGEREAAPELPARAPIAVEGAPAAEARPAPSGESALSGPGEVVVSGTIVILDELGKEHASEHGRIDVRSWKENGPQRELAVDVVRGAFSFRIPAGDEILVD
jgi:hypothetical protein